MYSGQHTIGEIVRKDYRTAQVFKNYKIDFCCGGRKTLDQVCEDKNIPLSRLLDELISLEPSTTAGGQDFNKWEADQLADYITSVHHAYVENNVPILRQYLKKLSSVHGASLPYLIEIEQIFNESASNLIQHMKKEEIILFPFIKKMCVAQKDNATLSIPFFGDVENPIQMMVSEHEAEGSNFSRIEKLSSGYDVPDWACNTYAVCMRLLREFHTDLQEHIHLENNILFPKAVELQYHLSERTLPSHF